MALTVVPFLAATMRTSSRSVSSIASVMFFMVLSTVSRELCNVSPLLSIILAPALGRASGLRVSHSSPPAGRHPLGRFLLHRRHDLLRRIVQIVRRNHVQPGLADDLLAQFDV